MRFAEILRSARRRHLTQGLAPFLQGENKDPMHIGTMMYPVEKAMRSSNWIAAYKEMWSLYYMLPLRHPMVYNRLCRVFNETLGTNLATKEPMHLKKEKVHDYEAVDFLRRIQGALRAIQFEEKGDEGKRIAIDYVVEVVKEAYRASFHEHHMIMMWQDGWGDGNPEPFPREYYANGKRCAAEVTEYTGAPLDINQCCLTGSVHDRKKVVSSYSDILRQGVHQEKGFYSAIYYPEAGIYRVVNGRHHTAMSSLLRNGGEITPTYECRLSQFFPHVKTDGAYWIDIASGKRMHRAADYRAATIYELLRLRHTEME